MNQKDKSKISKDKIIAAAICEFGTKNYENASLNNICNDNGISKGLIYHYFKNKDELYLVCVENCFNALVDFIKNKKIDFVDFNKDMEQYLNIRSDFFSNNPYYSKIFFNAILQPPKHLISEIASLRHDFNNLNTSYYQKAISNVSLREGISKDEAVEFLILFQDMFNGYFQGKSKKSSDLNSLIKDHENQLPKIFNIILYGMAKEDN